MTSREVAHVTLPRHLLVPQVITALNSAAFDTLGAESASILIDLGGGNIAAAPVTFTLQEGDTSTGPWTTVDPYFAEWFQDGVPGNVSGVAGSQVWVKSMPGFGGALTINTEANITNKTYSVSYVGGLHRYIRLNVADAGSPSNLIAVLGLLGNPRATAGLVFNNYPTPADFPSIDTSPYDA